MMTVRDGRQGWQARRASPHLSVKPPPPTLINTGTGISVYRPYERQYTASSQIQLAPLMGSATEVNVFTAKWYSSTCVSRPIEGQQV